MSYKVEVVLIPSGGLYSIFRATILAIKSSQESHLREQDMMNKFLALYR